MLTEQELADFGKMAESTIKEGKEHVSGFWQDMTAEELARHPAFKKAVAIQRLLAELDALRKRNEKLERVASRLYDIIGCFSYDGAPLVAVEQEGEIVNLPVDRTLAQAIARADEALAELDKEDA